MNRARNSEINLSSKHKQGQNQQQQNTNPPNVNSVPSTPKILTPRLMNAAMNGMTTPTATQNIGPLHVNAHTFNQMNIVSPQKTTTIYHPNAYMPRPQSMNSPQPQSHAQAMYGSGGASPPFVQSQYMNHVPTGYPNLSANASVSAAGSWQPTPNLLMNPSLNISSIPNV